VALWKRGTPDQQPLTDEQLRTLDEKKLAKRHLALDRELDGQDDSARALELERIMAELCRRLPEESGLWYDRGMYAKWRRDWSASVQFNGTALDLLPVDGRNGEPAAWNLGIAATALSDWATARRAWTSFGIELPDGAEGSTPIEGNFGPAPVRLNPDPRFVGEEPLVIDGNAGGTEVVWGQRLCPTRIQIQNIPLPDSGHRWGDIVLHDGDPVGTRRWGDRDIGVFNEIALWQRSELPTLSVTFEAPGPEAVGDLMDQLDQAGLGGEDWTRNVQMLCKACSEGTPAAKHDHQTGDADWSTRRHAGLAGRPDDIRPILEQWAAEGPGRTWSDLEVALD
jgi:hypothetical protein